MLEIQSLSQFYMHKGAKVEVIKNVNLSIKDNEFVAFVGPSGCGKSTLLRLISGLMLPTGGKIVLDRQTVTGPGRERGVVFQHFSLCPWLNVEENIAFGLNLHQKNEKAKADIVAHYLEITHLKQYAKFYPKALSGGMQQRVAIARAFANDPKILLMDEPFGALDPQMRGQLHDFVTQIYAVEHKTIVFITHDVTEAILLADTVYVMSPKPMEIKSTFSIPFPRPRHHSLKYTDAFFELERKIAKELEFTPETNSCV